MYYERFQKQHFHLGTTGFFCILNIVILSCTNVSADGNVVSENVCTNKIIILLVNF